MPLSLGWRPLWLRPAPRRACTDSADRLARGYAKRAARDFLLERLGAGPAKADDLFEEAEQHGIGDDGQPLGATSEEDHQGSA